MTGKLNVRALEKTFSPVQVQESREAGFLLTPTSLEGVPNLLTAHRQSQGWVGFASLGVSLWNLAFVFIKHNWLLYKQGCTVTFREVRPAQICRLLPIQPKHFMCRAGACQEKKQGPGNISFLSSVLQGSRGGDQFVLPFISSYYLTSKIYFWRQFPPSKRKSCPKQKSVTFPKKS